MPTVHLNIKGKVQGVFFRATAKKIAEKYDLAGWIKNSENGSVEAVVTGKEDAIEMFINWCRQGPANAKVTDVNVTYEAETTFKNFFVKR